MGRGRGGKDGKEMRSRIIGRWKQEGRRTGVGRRRGRRWRIWRVCRTGGGRRG